MHWHRLAQSAAQGASYRSIRSVQGAADAETWSGLRWIIREPLSRAPPIEVLDLSRLAALDDEGVAVGWLVVARAGESEVALCSVGARAGRSVRPKWRQC